MRKYLVFPILFIATISVFQSSCKSEKDKYADKIIGRWDISEGFRDGLPTQSLENLYFIFENNNKLKTNLSLSGTEEEGTYELDKDILKQQTNLPTQYKIISLEGNNMVLEATIRDAQFKFILTKK